MLHACNTDGKRAVSASGDNTLKVWDLAAIKHDSSPDNIRPVIPLWQSERAALIWLRGQMRAYTDYTFDIVGIISERH
jgi:hypothetical protein